MLTLNGEVNHTVKKVLNYEKLHTVIHRQQQKKKLYLQQRSLITTNFILFFFTISSFAQCSFLLHLFALFGMKTQQSTLKFFFIVFMLSVKHVACNIQQQHFVLFDSTE